MKVVILAGGHGTRISEESDSKPKPMVNIGPYPILWHIMKMYSHYNINDFIILCGYKSYVIKEYFSNMFLHNSNVTIDIKENKITSHGQHGEQWRVTLLETGLNTMTGGRILHAKPYVEHETFLLTYGDGLSDVNINELIAFHRNHKKILTVTAVQPEARFGALNIQENNMVTSFIEKPKGDGVWVNGGFFVCEPGLFDYIEQAQQGEQTIFEREPLEKLAHNRELVARKHVGFWQPMDTLRDKIQLTKLWENNQAPWKNWV